MELQRPIDRLDVAILTITAILAAVAVMRNDREAARLLHEGPLHAFASSSAQTGWTPLRRVASDFKAFLAVATLGVGLTVLSHPGRLRTRSWPAPGLSAMAVGALAEIFMIAWHIQLVSQGHYYWYAQNLTSLVVLGTVARIQFRTARAILGTWVVLALSRRWRPRIEPLDRLGRFLAWCWIGLTLLHTIAPRFWML